MLTELGDLGVPLSLAGVLLASRSRRVNAFHSGRATGSRRGSPLVSWVAGRSVTGRSGAGRGLRRSHRAVPAIVIATADAIVAISQAGAVVSLGFGVAAGSGWRSAAACCGAIRWPAAAGRSPAVPAACRSPGRLPRGYRYWRIWSLGWPSARCQVRGWPGCAWPLLRPGELAERRRGCGVPLGKVSRSVAAAIGKAAAPEVRAGPLRSSAGRALVVREPVTPQ